MTSPDSSDVLPDLELILSIPGTAADHLYREGSAKASFWEALFGSSLSAKRRTHVSALANGTRVFEVPLGSVEHELLRSAEAWAKAPENEDLCREAAALLADKAIAVTLVGLQPQGNPVASFALRFEVNEPAIAVHPAVPGAFRSWFGAEGPRIAEETLIPFGFTPHTP